MSKYIFTIDSSCDCPLVELQEKDVPVIRFRYFEGEDNHIDEMDPTIYKDFYQKMRDGHTYSTSQINPTEYMEFFKEQMKKYGTKQIIHISLCEGLSGTINSARLAARQMLEEDKEAKVLIVDPTIASLGSTMMLYEGLRVREEGMEFEEAFKYLQEKALHINTYYTTDTLTFFAKGGRLSKAAAFVGNAFKICPILDCKVKGELDVIAKIRTTKKALDFIVQKVKETVIDPTSQMLYVCTADNEELGKELAERLIQECGFTHYRIYAMGPIIAAHAGPGLLSVFYYGKTRELNGLSKD